MAKRFIDTGIFDDSWFMDLSPEGKIFWFYCLTKCDHAGILALNPKLCRVQTGIENIETVTKELGNRLVTVREQLFFIPKFVEYQYPDFPDCKFKAALSAISILEKYDLFKDGKVTVGKELPNSYSISKSISKSKSIGNSKSETAKINSDYSPEIKALYEKVIPFMNGLHDLPGNRLTGCYDTLEKLVRIDGKTPEHIFQVIKWAKEDTFWTQNFLSLNKLRKLNKDGIMNFIVFEQKMQRKPSRKNSGYIDTSNVEYKPGETL